MVLEHRFIEWRHAGVPAISRAGQFRITNRPFWLKAYPDGPHSGCQVWVGMGRIPTTSPLARRTTARPADGGRGRGVVADSAGTYLQRARSERGRSARASATDRAIATQGV